MDTLSAQSQSSPRQQQQSNNLMPALVCFNVGGKQYYVSPSFLEQHSNTLLAQIASEQWKTAPGEEIFLERDRYIFQYVLDYLQNDGCVFLPIFVPKVTFLDELMYYEINDVDMSKIDYYFYSFWQFLDFARATMRANIQAWDGHDAITTLAKECGSRYLSCGIDYPIEIHCPESLPDEVDDKGVENDEQGEEEDDEEEEACTCSIDTYNHILTLLDNEEMKLLPHDKEECNQILGNVGLEIINAKTLPGKSIIKIALCLTKVRYVPHPEHPFDFL